MSVHSSSLVPLVPADLVEDSVHLPSTLKKKIFKENGGKHQHLLNSQLISLQNELKKTKQNIVKHIIQSRAIEQSKTNLIRIQQSLHSHLLEKSDPDYQLNRQRRENAINYQFSITKFPLSVLQSINSQLVGWNYPGLIDFLLEKLSNYSIGDFQKNLESYPIPNENEVSLDFYTQVVLNGSNFMLTEYEVVLLFEKGKLRFSQESRETGKEPESLWKILKRLLYKKLLILYLIQQASFFIADAEKKMEYKEHFQYKQQEKKTVPSSSSSHHNLSSFSVDNASMSSSLASSYDKQLLSSSLSSVEFMKKDRKKGKKNQESSSLQQSLLAKELKQSIEQQNKLKEQIVNNFHEIVLTESSNQRKQQQQLTSSSLLSSSVSSLPDITSHQRGGTTTTTKNGSRLSSSSESKHGSSLRQPTPAIKQYYYNIGLMKLFQFLENRYLHILYTKKWKQWKSFLKFTQLENNVILFCKKVSYYRFYYLLSYNIIRRLTNRFVLWNEYCKYYKNQEIISSAITIQRFYRGYLGRKYHKQLSSNHAATCINNLMKIFIAKKLLKKHRMKLKQRKSIRKIEKAWKSSRLCYSINHRIVAKQQMKGIKAIQRYYRGYCGRKRYVRRYQYHQMIKGAMKMQCLFRKYKAIVKVEQLRYRRKRLLACILLQKVVRSKLQRVKFSLIWKKYQKAKIIQYSWLCYKARKIRNEKYRNKCAIKIQKIIRGKLGRKRFQYYLSMKRKEIQKKFNAITAITPFGIAFITRRKWGKILQEYRQNRNNAAKIIQQKLQAVQLGKIARKRVEDIKENQKLIIRRKKAATKIQSIMRMKLAKMKVLLLFKQREAMEKQQDMSVPYYYRLKKKYLGQQNTYHYQQVRKIQCLIRCFLAKKKVELVRTLKEEAYLLSMNNGNLHMMDAESLKLLSERLAAAASSRRTIAGGGGGAGGEGVQDAMLDEISRKIQVQQMENLRYLSIIKVQKVFRGFYLRLLMKRNNSVPLLKFLCREAIIRYKIKKFLVNYRLVLLLSLVFFLIVFILE
jgi:hypothetical protein